MVRSDFIKKYPTSNFIESRIMISINKLIQEWYLEYNGNDKFEYLIKF
jgi:hypothetical protein